MSHRPIPINQFAMKPYDQWANQCLLLACGYFSKNKYNAMTVGWGSFGVMWGKPFVQVVVRPTRYTYEFMEKYKSFTLSAFPDEFQQMLSLLGSKSGRHCNKIAESGLTPVASSKVNSPSFAEAELTVECVKMYWDDLKPGQFLDPAIDEHYPQRDYHRAYFGEIVAICGSSAYISG